MLKKLALPVVALAAMLSLTSAPAKAAVRFGVTIGPPVYTYPAYPYAAPYATPYVDPYYVAPNYYYAPAPAYVAPSFGLGFGFGGGHRDNRFEHRGNVQVRGHDDHGRGGFNGGANGGHRR